MIKWIKTLFRIVRDYDNLSRSVDSAHHNISLAEKVIRDRTDMHIDLHAKAPSQVILIGRYKNKDYVNIHNVQNEDLTHLIELCRNMEHHAVTRRVDAWPEISASFKRDVSW